MIKVAMIGAGSVVFCRNLTGDILSFPEFRNATLAYMDIDADRLAVGANLCRKVAGALGASPTIIATTDRREALAGADFVINMVQIGGFDSTLVDFEIPRKYGLNFTIADTTGPGGLFRALRTYPMLVGLCREMEEVCPKATLLNYSNPMGMNMQTVFRNSSVAAIGLCHSVQGTFEQLMRYLDEDPTAVNFVCAGINHMAFYLRLEKNGVDLYPRLFEAMNRPEVYGSNKVRFELMKRLGYFVTESSEHSAEYSPYFIPHGVETIAKYNVPIDEYLRRCDCIVGEFERLKKLGQSDEAVCVNKSHEYGSTIIHSRVTGTPSVVYGNMPNVQVDGTPVIANLPRSAIVEVATRVDGSGMRRETSGELPPQLVAYMQPHISQQELFIRAAMEGRRDHVYQAAMFDPLTAARLPLDRIVEMCDELIAAHGTALPNLDAKKTLVPTSGKTFGAVDAKALRASWDAAQAKAAKDFLLDWSIIGPFKSPRELHVSLEMATALEDEVLKRGDGVVDLNRQYESAGRALKWKPARADPKTGKIDLAAELGATGYAVAYAYAEIESQHPRDAVLKCGSDDGIRIWINGKIVHSNEAQRAYKPHSDSAVVHLAAGINRIFVKVDNWKLGWAFGVSVSKPCY